MSNLITIDASELPTRQVGVVIERPKYGSLRKARMLMPTVRQGDKDPVPYSTEELLLAMRIRQILPAGGEPHDLKEVKDVSKVLEPFDIQDLQFLQFFFLEAFWPSPEEVKRARATATEKANIAPTLKYVIDKDEFPSGEISVSFNRPNTGVKYQADKKWTSVEVNGCDFEEFMFAMCLSSVNGEPIVYPHDYISILDDWEIADVFYARFYFSSLFVLDTAGQERASNLGKRYRAGSKPTETATTTSDTSTPAMDHSPAIIAEPVKVSTPPIPATPFPQLENITFPSA